MNSRKCVETLASFLSRILLVFILGHPSSSPAQTGSGLISGAVTDPSQAVMVNANVVAREIHTGSVRSTVTNAEGFYSFSGLQPGDYDVSLEVTGFAPYVARVQVSVGSRFTLDPRLTLQPLHTKAVVFAEGGVQVETQTQMLSEVVNRQKITELPTLTRNPYDLVALSGNISPSDTTGQGVGVAINGQRAASTQITLDGGGNTDAYNATVGQAIPLDAVQQFRLSEGNFTAEYGGASGGIVDVETRSGTNQFHGTVYEFNRISALASNTFDNNARGFPRAVFTRNQFGYAVGGPIHKDKLFFFQSTEWTRVRSQQTAVAVSPTPEFIAASAPETQAYLTAFSGGLNPINGPKFIKADILASGLVPNPGGPFDMLPPSTPVFGQVTRVIAADAGGGNPQNTYSLVARVDYNTSDKTKIFGRYAQQSVTVLPGVASSNPYPQYDTASSVLNRNALIGLTRVFTPTVVTQTKLGFTLLQQDFPLGQAPPGPRLFFPDSLSVFGLPVVLPGYGIDPTNLSQYIWQIAHDMSWTKGNHVIRVGGSFAYFRTIKQGFTGALAVENLSSRGATSLDNFLLGEINTFRAAIDPQGKFPCILDPTGSPIVTPACRLNLPLQSPVQTRVPRNRDTALYAQDSWRIAKRLTLNLGLRWEYFGVQYAENPNTESNFYFGPGASLPAKIRTGQVLTVANSPIGSLYRPDYNNFGPRMGFAWDVSGNGRTSLRGGYGISFDRNFGFVLENLALNPPAYALSNLRAGTPQFPTLAVQTDNLGPLAGTSGMLPFPDSFGRQVDQNIKTAYAETWSLGLDHELLTNTVVSASYSGSHGVGLYTNLLTNIPGSGVVYAGDDPALNPFSTLNLQYSNLTDRTNGGFSGYHALLLRLQGENIRNTGVTVTANYTWSHAIDNLSSTLSNSPNAFHIGFLDFLNPGLDRGEAEFDERHRIVASTIWQLPFYADSPQHWERILLSGWGFASIFSATTGSPFTIFDCTNAVTVCPRYIPSFPVAHSGHAVDIGEPNFFQYIPLSPAVTYVNPLVGFSDLPDCTGVPAPPCRFPAEMTKRDAFVGPGHWNIDLAVHKTFSLHEKWSLQFRGELFNAFNHSNLVANTGFAEISTNPDFVSAKKIGNRNVQLAVKLNF